MSGKPGANGPLGGVRVLELANVVSGPTCGQILGDFGADVIKVEHPDGGDGMRKMGMHKKGISLWTKIAGRNKKSVSMYLGDPEVAEIFVDLCASADVIIENFRPGTLEKWNLGYERLSARNKGLILVRITGFGQTGPYSGQPAFGTLLEAMSGVAHITGEPDGPPILPGINLADYMSAYATLSAIMMALYHRDARGGTGQVVDVSLFDPLIMALSNQIVLVDQLGIDTPRVGNRSPGSAPRNVYLTKDGKWVALAAVTPETAGRVMKMVGRADMASQDWFKTSLGRFGHVDEIDDAIQAWTKTHTRDEVVRIATAGQVTLAPVNTVAEMMRDPHIIQREMIVSVDDEELGPIKMPNLLYRMSKTPGKIRWTGRSLGADTDEILENELGLDPERIGKLRQRGVVGAKAKEK